MADFSGAGHRGEGGRPQTCSGERTVTILLPSAASTCSNTETDSCSIGPRTL